ncbi:MAG TPA: hypothetical protein VHL10_08100 [Nitrososphaera sp.]|jgi:hypothetical protein|nr:hypothetical protein [Nitrososphaera sp.]
MPDAMQSQKEKLNRVYVCTRCSGTFLFKSDVEDHREFLGHLETYEIPLN